MQTKTGMEETLTVFLLSLASFPCPARSQPPFRTLLRVDEDAGSHKRLDWPAECSGARLVEVRTDWEESTRVPHAVQILEPASSSQRVRPPHSKQRALGGIEGKQQNQNLVFGL
jgi:hypothetical protein